MNKELQVFDLNLTLDMMKEKNLPVISVTTNDPLYEKDNRPVRNVTIVWSTNPAQHELKLAEWCAMIDRVGTVRHVVKES